MLFVIEYRYLSDNINSSNDSVKQNDSGPVFDFLNDTSKDDDKNSVSEVDSLQEDTGGSVGNSMYKSDLKEENGKLKIGDYSFPADPKVHAKAIRSMLKKDE